MHVYPFNPGSICKNQWRTLALFVLSTEQDNCICLRLACGQTTSLSEIKCKKRVKRSLCGKFSIKVYLSVNWSLVQLSDSNNPINLSEPLFPSELPEIWTTNCYCLWGCQRSANAKIRNLAIRSRKSGHGYCYNSTAIQDCLNIELQRKSTA